MDVSKYEGDGDIFSVGRLFYPGYIIEFEKFILAKSFSQQYKIVNLPKSNKTIYCGLVLRSVDDVSALSDASLALTLESPKQGIVFSCKAPLKEWRQSKVEREGGNEYFFYFLTRNNTSSFNYKDVSREDHLLLNVNFESQTNFDIEGIVQIRAGGHK